jgi:cytosine/adenosine deaminase-related metal-dependent hydrolase
MGVIEVRGWLVNTASRYGSHDPEDIAHTVIERALRHGTAFTKPYPYWRKAAYNEVVSAARQRRLDGNACMAFARQTPDSDAGNVRTNSRERLRRACSVVGIGGLLWLARYARKRNHTGQERAKAWKLRQRLREPNSGAG